MMYLCYLLKTLRHFQRRNKEIDQRVNSEKHMLQQQTTSLKHKPISQADMFLAVFLSEWQFIHIS